MPGAINVAVDSPYPIDGAASYSGNIKATVVAVRTTASKALLPLCLGVTHVDCLCLAEGVGWGETGCAAAGYQSVAPQSTH